MLAISTKYALKVLQQLATTPDEFVSIDSLSKESDVPGPYLSKIMKALADREVVVTKKGFNGGVMLPRKNVKLSFYDICEALDDPVVQDRCFLSKKKCGGDSPCALHAEWSVMKKKIHAFLTRSKLA